MIKLRTTIPVVTNPKTLEENIVTMEIKDIIYNFQWYTAGIDYYIEKEIYTGEFTEETVVDPVTENTTVIQVPIKILTKIPLETSYATFTCVEANMIEQAIGGLQGTSLTEKFNNLINAGIMFQLSQAPVYGCDHTQWEIVPANS